MRVASEEIATEGRERQLEVTVAEGPIVRIAFPPPARLQTLGPSREIRVRCLFGAKLEVRIHLPPAGSPLRTCEPDFRGLRNLKRQKLALDEVTVRERTPEAEPD